MATVKRNKQGIQQAQRLAEKEMRRRMARAGSVLVSETKRLINRSNYTGDAPSAPGEPPKKVTGYLQTQQRFEVRGEGKDLALRYGSNVVYQRALELGYVGENRVLEPRPHLRVALANKRREVRRIMRGEA